MIVFTTPLVIVFRTPLNFSKSNFSVRSERSGQLRKKLQKCSHCSASFEVHRSLEFRKRHAARERAPTFFCRSSRSSKPVGPRCCTTKKPARSLTYAEWTKRVPIFANLHHFKEGRAPRRTFSGGGCAHYAISESLERGRVRNGASGTG